MGMYQTIIVTPYIVSPNSIEVDDIKIERFCDNHKSIKQITSKFCKECGYKLTELEIPIKTKKSIYHILDEICEDNNLCIPEHPSVIIPNQKPPGNIKIDEDGCSLDMSSGGFFESQGIMNIQLEWFNSKYSNEILELKKVFGEENVKVKWGIVVYYS